MDSRLRRERLERNSRTRPLGFSVLRPFSALGSKKQPCAGALVLLAHLP
jgi:hypothetical protein